MNIDQLKKLKEDATQFQKLFNFLKSKNLTSAFLASMLGISPTALSPLMRHIIPDILDAKNEHEINSVLAGRNIKKNKVKYGLSDLIEVLEGIVDETDDTNSEISKPNNINHPFTVSNTSNSIINGVWLVDFMSEGKQVIEIYYFQQKDLNVNFVWQHYKNSKEASNNVLLGEGKGYRRDNKLGLVYNAFKSNTNKLGTLVLNIADLNMSEIELVGNFFEPFNDEIYSSQSAKLKFRKIRLLGEKLKKLQLNKEPCFKDYNDIASFFKISKQ